MIFFCSSLHKFSFRSRITHFNESVYGGWAIMSFNRDKKMKKYHHQWEYFDRKLDEHLYELLVIIWLLSLLWCNQSEILLSLFSGFLTEWISVLFTLIMKCSVWHNNNNKNPFYIQNIEIIRIANWQPRNAFIFLDVISKNSLYAKLFIFKEALCSFKFLRSFLIN